MSALIDKLTVLRDGLKAEGHHLVALAEDVLAHFKTDVPVLETEARADVAQVEADTVKAAAPVVAEVEHDAEHLASEAVTDAKDAINPAPAQHPDPTVVTPTA
jgi:hypothetical protein